MTPVEIIPLDKLSQPGSTTKDVDNQGQPLSIMIVRTHSQVYGYLNRCPHRGTPLDWTPGVVLDRNGEHILCATHGARFSIDTGMCISGPCYGESLTSIPLRISEGRIYLLKEETTAS